MGEKIRGIEIREYSRCLVKAEEAIIEAESRRNENLDPTIKRLSEVAGILAKELKEVVKCT